METIDENAYMFLKIDEIKYKFTPQLFGAFLTAILKFSPCINQVKYNGKYYDINNHSDNKLIKLSNKKSIDIEYYFDDSIEIDEEYIKECIIEEYYENADDNTKDMVFSKLIELFDKININSTIEFIGYDEIVLKNKRGINHDTRGTRDNIKLPYHESYVINNPMTLEELFVGYHKIKSHKFDYWYELFINIEIKFNKINDVDTLAIYCDFDHGS
jgi:hypothetical protein